MVQVAGVTDEKGAPESAPVPFPKAPWTWCRVVGQINGLYVLLETEDVSPDPDVDAAWDQEIQHRIRAVDSGAVAGISYQDVMLEAEKRLAP